MKLRVAEVASTSVEHLRTTARVDDINTRQRAPPSTGRRRNASPAVWGCTGWTQTRLYIQQIFQFSSVFLVSISDSNLRRYFTSLILCRLRHGTCSIYLISVPLKHSFTSFSLRPVRRHFERGVLFPSPSVLSSPFSSLPFPSPPLP